MPRLRVLAYDPKSKAVPKLVLEPEMEDTTLYMSHLRTLAKSMDAATLQSALEFHRMHVRVLGEVMEARMQSSTRSEPPAARHAAVVE